MLMSRDYSDEKEAGDIEGVGRHERRPDDRRTGRLGSRTPGGGDLQGEEDLLPADGHSRSGHRLRLDR